jgi:hypothetical protein
MAYKSIRFVGFFALIVGCASVLGAAALTFGPWAQPSQETTRAMLTFCFLAFSMVGTLATNAATIFESQADEIAELRRQVADQRTAHVT